MTVVARFLCGVSSAYPQKRARMSRPRNTQSVGAGDQIERIFSQDARILRESVVKPRGYAKRPPIFLKEWDERRLQKLQSCLTPRKLGWITRVKVRRK